MTSGPKPLAYGAAPWHQTSWDLRAAGNFVGGGSGSGLIVFTVWSGATGTTESVLLVAGLALVALGLGSVALELGRPLRALNVFRNPRTSWMSREAIAGLVLMVVTTIALAGVRDALPLCALAALAFMFCQARLLQAARGIPAWREPAMVPLLVSTALAEGAGLFCATSPWHGMAPGAVLAAAALLVLLRALAFRAYHERLARKAPRARTALAPAARALLLAGTIAPLALLALAALAPGSMVTSLVALAGIATVAAGWVLKLVVVTRAGFNRGFALAQLPVRGARP